MLEPELVRKHIKRLMEVKAYTRRSTKGKIYNVKAYERKVQKLIGKRLKFNEYPGGDTDAWAASRSGIFKGLDSHGNAVIKQPKRDVAIPASEIPALRKAMGKKSFSSMSPSEMGKVESSKKGRKSFSSANDREWKKIEAHWASTHHGGKPSGPQQDMFARQAWERERGKKKKKKQAPPGIVPGQGSNRDFWGNRYK